VGGVGHDHSKVGPAPGRARIRVSDLLGYYQVPKTMLHQYIHTLLRPAGAGLRAYIHTLRRYRKPPGPRAQAHTVLRGTTLSCALPRVLTEGVLVNHRNGPPAQ
jgi:hypothetical protein